MSDQIVAITYQASFFLILFSNAFYPVLSTAATFSIGVFGVTILFNPLLISIVSGLSIVYLDLYMRALIDAVIEKGRDFWEVFSEITHGKMAIIILYTVWAFIGNFVSTGAILTALTFGMHVFLTQALSLSIALPVFLLWAGLINALTKAELIKSDSQCGQREWINNVASVWSVPAIVFSGVVLEIIPQEYQTPRYKQ